MGGGGEIFSTLIGGAVGVGVGIATANPWAGVAAGTAAAGLFSSATAYYGYEGIPSPYAYYEALARQQANLIPWQEAMTQYQLRALEQQNEIMAKNLEMAKAEAELAQKIGVINEQGALADAKLVETQAKKIALQIRREADAIAGQQVVGYHKAGVVLSGTPALVMNEDRERAEMDVYEALTAGEFQSQELRREGKLARLQAAAVAAQAYTRGINIAGDISANVFERGMVRNRGQLEVMSTMLAASNLRYQGYLAAYETALTNWRLRSQLRNDLWNSLLSGVGAFASFYGPRRARVPGQGRRA